MQNGSVLGASECPDTLQYKGKTEAEPSKVEEAREGKRATEGNTGHHGQAVAATTAHGVYHGQAVVPTAVVVAWLPPNAAFWSSWFFALGRRFLPFLGYFGLFLLSSFDPHDPHFISLDSSQTFSPKILA